MGIINELPIYSFNYLLEKAGPGEKEPLLSEQYDKLSYLSLESQTNHPATTHKFEENQKIREGIEQSRSERELKKQMSDVSDNFLDQIAQFSFVKQLHKGEIDLDRYRQHLKNLDCIHKALQEGQLKLLEKGIDDFVFPLLWREVSLKKDIDAWGAGDKVPTPDAYDYAQYVLMLADEKPAFFILHLFSIYWLHFYDAVDLKDKIQSAYEKISAKGTIRGNNAFCYPGIHASKFETIWRLELNEMYKRFHPSDSFEEYHESCINEVKCLFTNFIKIVKL
ncbi:MAG TPA: biliverdin-producing heme oxygenase [Rhabdochlamydiaceae bacterium]|nr:biliverdin-producing heme oxygenase [Rhabdochlamydiaceae bacterium]